MTRRMPVLFVAAVLAAAPFSSFPLLSQQPATRAQAEQDPVLKAMIAELERNQARLYLKDSVKPYFIEFRIDDVVEYDAKTANGALENEHETHTRLARVRVRVGDYKFDNSRAKAPNRLMEILEHMGFGGDGMIAVEVLDDDPVALRYSLWTAADTAYKLALDDYAAKQAELKTIETPPDVDSFAQEKPVIVLEPVRHLELDREAWRRNIAAASGLIFNNADAKQFASEIEESNGSLRARVRTEYLVNSEGTIVRKSTAEYHAETAFAAQAPDGMRLERSYSVAAEDAAGLGDGDRFQLGSLHALQGLDELCKAPAVQEEYDGPVLLLGNAASRRFEELFARAIEAHPPALGSMARTTGPFASSYGLRVLPDFMSVSDNPLMTNYAGKELIGAYQVDDEGVLAQKVSVVENGKLTGYLLGREPIRGFPQSNGHGRAESGKAPSPSIGVLDLEVTGGISNEDLEKKLIAMGKDEGLSYVYVVQTGGARTMYRIGVADGKRQLVRGASLGELNLRAFRSGIVAAGDKPYVDNMFGDVPRTVIAPALLFSDLTVKQAEQKDSRLPFYPPPTQ